MSEETTYKTIRAQNKTLYNSILNMHEMYSTSENRIKYKTINYEQTRYILTIVFYLYYAVFLNFMLMIFLMKFCFPLNRIIKAINNNKIIKTSLMIF